jgi:hypothetical protein
MHSRLVLIYAGCGDLAAATSVAAPPYPPPPSPFRLLRCVFDLRLATSCGPFFLFRLARVLWTSYHALVAGQM